MQYRCNPKKRLTLPTKTVYFNPSKDRLYNSFSSPNSYKFRQQRIEGYEMRLYWQFLYCLSIGCPTFYYTLTYNDSNVPHKYGIPCFDYEDLRYLLTGGFRKQLLRKYGLTFKYFIGAELGEGAGKRGLHNNPHYHILFFLEPANNPKFPFKSITPLEFRSLVRLYWQGFDQELGFKDFKSACKFGIVQEGENDGLVTDYRACFYCAKYVCKDVKLKMKELDIPKLLRFNLKKSFKDSPSFNREFLEKIVRPLYEIPNSSYPKISLGSLLHYIVPSTCDFVDVLFADDIDSFYDNENTIVWTAHNVCEKLSLWKEYYKFLSEKIDESVAAAITEWRNRHSNKVRISQGVGDYALDFIDTSSPLIRVPSKNGFKYRSINQYYFRKLYTGVVHGKEFSFNGKMVSTGTVRVLTQAGIDYKVSLLESSLRKKSEKAKNSFSLLINDESLFNLMRSSDVNTECSLTYSSFLQRVSDLGSDLDLLFDRYASFKLVYEFRYFDAPLTGFEFPKIDVFKDYRRFLQPSVFSVPRSDLFVEEFLKSDKENYLPFDVHPYFLKFLSLFKVLDLFDDYMFVCNDDVSQCKAEDIAEKRRFHKLRVLSNS